MLRRPAQTEGTYSGLGGEAHAYCTSALGGSYVGYIPAESSPRRLGDLRSRSECDGKKNNLTAAGNRNTVIQLYIQRYRLCTQAPQNPQGIPVAVFICIGMLSGMWGNLLNTFVKWLHSYCKT
jgi:hypothetical protein